MTNHRITRNEVNAFVAACQEVGLPRHDVKALIAHHRGNAALAATLDATLLAALELADAAYALGKASTLFSEQTRYGEISATEETLGALEAAETAHETAFENYARLKT